MAKKLVIDLDALNKCYKKLTTATEKMESIQKNLHDAMNEMLKNGWVGDGSKAFNKQFESCWVDGIQDRVDVMKRMCEHLENAKKYYEPVYEDADKITINR